MLRRRVLDSRTMPITSPTRRLGDYLRLKFFICDECQAFATAAQDALSSGKRASALTRQCCCIPIVAAQPTSRSAPCSPEPRHGTRLSRRSAAGLVDPGKRVGFVEQSVRPGGPSRPRRYPRFKTPRASEGDSGNRAIRREPTPPSTRMSDRRPVDGLSGIWRKQVRTLCEYGGETPAVAIESCAVQLEDALRESDEAILTLTDTTRESGYSADHLGRLVCHGKIPNAGRPGAPRASAGTSPAKPARPRHVWRPSPRLARFPPCRSCSPSSRRLMMARTKRRRRSYSAGEWGRNRVRVFPDPKTGLIQIEWRKEGRRRSRSLGHRDWDRAKRQADEVAAGRAGPHVPEAVEAEPAPLTLNTLFDIYGDEVTPTKGEQSQRYDEAAMKMFLGFFGKDRVPATLSQRDWDRFIRQRRAGRVGPSGRPVSNRTIERDLKFLLAVLNWAAKSRDEEGRLLLESNPLRGLKLPREKNPAGCCSPTRNTRLCW